MSPQSVFPNKEWEPATPESQGVDSVRLNEALRLLETRSGPDGISQTMVIRHGRVIWKGPHTGSWHNIFSCTKSLLSMCAGLLIDDGICALDTRLSDFVPEIEKLYPETTVRLCLSLTTGYNAQDSTYPFTPAPPLFRDGAAFHYFNDGPNLLTLALARAAGEPLDILFKCRIADPLGIDERWLWGDFGQIGGLRINNGAGGLFKGVHTTAENIARVGLLLLNKGRWNSASLLSEDWIAQSSRSQSAADLPVYDPEDWYKIICGAYGFGFWVNGIRPDGHRLWQTAPAGAFAMQGKYSNSCFIIPEWDMVFVRLGTDGLRTGAYHHFFSRLNASLLE